MNFSTVGDLVDHLSKYPRDLQILQACDSEGNSFSSLDECSEMYVDKHYDGGRIDDEVWDEEDLTGGLEPEEYDDTLSGFQKVLVFWPI